MTYHTTAGYTYSLSNLKRINNFKSFLSKKTGYVYSGTNSISVSESGSDKLKSGEFEGYGRDKFYTNMLESKSDTNVNIPVSITEFSYDYENASGEIGDVDSNDIYTTAKAITNSNAVTLNETPEYVKTIRNYTVYPLHNTNTFYLEQPDLQGITKLMSDSTFTDSLSMQVNKYYYHLGEYLTSFCRI
ncbi:MAG: hypothetical protein IPM96_20485 [Ignavibacteria bacterium]|nr:hypothetical protein [Ignavibacteria bacterium]